MSIGKGYTSLSVAERTYNSGGAGADSGADPAEEHHQKSWLSLAGSAALDVRVSGAHPRADDVPVDPVAFRRDGLLSGAASYARLRGGGGWGPFSGSRARIGHWRPAI